MTNQPKAAAIGRTALFACAAFGAFAVAAPAFADPIDVITAVRVPNVQQPVTDNQRAVLKSRIAMAAEEACGSNDRSLRDFRIAVRKSDCFRESYSQAMNKLEARWGAATGGGMR
ncbi:UrcA family protein [Sphingomonas immobilis]|jgi:UrcA family protein|uniref:UrcA family protein n=1 Tax=Sphingomonas immobilis TaxID=3063997 RepID=A0ABT9A4C4_9SPHN|nr:UrcA family protein [Sphingomonas sp. CA1-15]MDO7844695.1 UrcA family protein [Sphingomonas sp. CA1-15]